jgi:CheY-like chemotaxis protein
MLGLWHSGLAHVLRGESSIDELLRVVDVPPEQERAAPEPTRRSGGSATTATATSAPHTPGRPSPAPPPAAPPAAAPEHFGASFELLEELAGGRAGPSGPARKVLLVDDEDSLRKVLKDLLERDGYEVSEARDGLQALDQVDRVGPDIIVLDLNLPALDGYGVLSQLRSRPATAGIPVIVLTAKGDEDNEVRVFELGADDFLQKPFRARALSARLEAVLGRRRPA